MGLAVVSIWTSLTYNIQGMQNVCLFYENCLLDPGTIIFAPRVFFCFRVETSSCLAWHLKRRFFANQTAFFVDQTTFFCRTLFSGCFSTTFFLCNGVFFTITTKKYASPNKGKNFALWDVAGVIVLLFFGSMGKGLLSVGKQSIRKNLPLCCYKLPGTSVVGPTPPPWISITDFKIRCHLTQKGVGMIVEWASIYIIYDVTIQSFEKAWTWHVGGTSVKWFDGHRIWICTLGP